MQIIMSSHRHRLALLLNGLQVLEGSADMSDEELRYGLMSHALGCLSVLGAFPTTTSQPTHDFIFEAALKRIMERNLKIASGDSLVESFPTKWIFQQFPRETATASWLPLHWCAALSDDTEEINANHLHELMKEDPTLQLISDQYEVSPCSLATAKRNPSQDFMKKLISLNADVVKIPDRDGAMALMYAGAWNEGTAVLEKIYSLNPKAISSTDAYGFLPLHFASYAGEVNSVSFLLSKYPKAARIKNRAGVLPLLASAANARHGGVEMARILLEEYPEAISIADDEGSLPLHIAAQFASFDLIRFLYAVNPSAASTPNVEGLLPMHFAGLRKEKNIDIVDFLTEANTDAEAAKFVPAANAGKEECIIS